MSDETNTSAPEAVKPVLPEAPTASPILPEAPAASKIELPKAEAPKPSVVLPKAEAPKPAVVLPKASVATPRAVAPMPVMELKPEKPSAISLFVDFAAAAVAIAFAIMIVLDV